jgi:hypothetical protein
MTFFSGVHWCPLLLPVYTANCIQTLKGFTDSNPISWDLSATVCTVRVFRQQVTLEGAIGSHACSLEANIRVTNVIPLGSSLSYQLTL